MKEVHADRTTDVTPIRDDEYSHDIEKNAVDIGSGGGRGPVYDEGDTTASNRGEVSSPVSEKNHSDDIQRPDGEERSTNPSSDGADSGGHAEERKQNGNAKASGSSTPSASGWRSKLWKWSKIVFWFILSQWLVIGLGIACMLAALFPNVAARDGIIHSQDSILYGAVSLIFFISGMQITREKLVSHVTNWRLHIIVQFMSFLITPALMLALVHIFLAANALHNNPPIDVSLLVGLIALGGLPTTISSNVVLTRNAGGDDAAAMIEVMIGNVLGPFITPALINWLLPKDPEFGPWSPTATASLGNLYRNVFKQIGLSVLIPLAVGQLVQWLWPVRTKWAVEKFYLAKVSTACLLLLVWSTFSSCFKSGALYQISHTTVICNVFLNLGIYIFFTAICFYLARPRSFPLPSRLRRSNPSTTPSIPPPVTTKPQQTKSTFLSRLKTILLHQIPKEETIAICFCGAAKTTGLGVPMVAAMWANSDPLIVDQIQIPVVLYTTEQIFCAQVFVYVFRRWLKKADGDGDVDGEGVQGERREEILPT